MAKMIGTKIEVINGQEVVIKVYGPSRSDLAGQTKARYMKCNRAGAMFVARERGLKTDGKKEE